MIADPCHSTLIPGIYGDQDGLLAKVQQTFSNPGVSTATCGYILWAPDYHDGPTNLGTSVAGTANLFVWTSDNSSTNPTNSDAFPYGAENNPFEPSTDSAGALPDPARDLLSSDLVADARTIASCMQMTYTGPMFEASGQFCQIENLPLDSVLTGGFSGLPPSVDDIFRLSTKKGRLGTDTREAVSRPSDLSGTFRNAETAPILVGSQGNTASLLTDPGRVQQPEFYGFAWRGIGGGNNTSPNPIVFELIKSIEWRPAPISGLTHAQPRTINPTSMVHKATQHLDKVMPGWTTRVVGALQTAGSALARAAFSGVGNLIGRQAANSMLTFEGGVAPLLLGMAM